MRVDGLLIMPIPNLDIFLKLVNKQSLFYRFANLSVLSSPPVPTLPQEPKSQPNKINKQIKKSYKKVKSKLQSNRVASQCFPPSGDVATALTISLVIIAVFFVARTVLGPIAAPGGTIFALLILILAALAGGMVIKLLTMSVSRLTGLNICLPPLLGMLLVGIIMKNVPYNYGQFGRIECIGNHSVAFGDSLNDISDFTDKVSGFDVIINRSSLNSEKTVIDSHQPSINSDQVTVENQMIPEVRKKRKADHVEKTAQDSMESSCKAKYIGHELDPKISQTLRSICLTVILLRAGLELDPVALWKLAGMVFRATFVPCLIEAVAAAVLSNLILGFPWTVGFVLGFVLAGVSPAVIIPNIMSLSERGYGVSKGIPTLVIATCSADDVVAIAGFGIFLGITFNTDASIVNLVFHGPIEVAMGLSFGIFWGILAQWIPNRNHKYVVFFRFLILFSGGLIALFGAHLLHYDGAGGLATLIMAFVAGIRWRKEGWGDHNPVSKLFRQMWIILEPVIFGLIGTAIQVDKIEPTTLGYSILVLLLTITIRMIGTFFAVTCGSLNTKEKIFLAFAWIPKATVQAALGEQLSYLIKSMFKGILSSDFHLGFFQLSVFRVVFKQKSF